jgi:intracellular sulfur oxidation DsrE/DsrF family protein
MASYLFIESLDPFESNDVARFWELAAAVARDGSSATLLLVQNGVLAARAGASGVGLMELAAQGVDVLADDFSLRERGIPSDRLVPGVKPTSLDVVIDHLAAGSKVLWH